MGFGLGLDEHDLVVGEEELEVGLDEAGGELLLSLDEQGFGFNDLGAGLPEGGPLHGLDEGLADGEGAGAAVVVLAGVHRHPGELGVGLQLVLVAGPADADLWKQLSPREGDGLAAGFGAGTGGAQHGVVGDGGLPGAVEVEPGGRVGLGRQGAGDEGGEG